MPRPNKREKKKEKGKKMAFGDYVGVKESFRMNEKNESEEEVRGSHKREESPWYFDFYYSLPSFIIYSGEVSKLVRN